MTQLYDRVALIGLGLIASSMAHAIRQGGLAREIVGYARSAETRATALEIGFVDRVTETAAEAVAGADLVVLAVPVGAMGAIAAEIGPHLAPGATVTDVGSVKQAVIAGMGVQVTAVRLSVPLVANVTLWVGRLYQPFRPFGVTGVGVMVAAGAVRSTLTVRLVLALFPA